MARPGRAAADRLLHLLSRAPAAVRAGVSRLSGGRPDPARYLPPFRPVPEKTITLPPGSPAQPDPIGSGGGTPRIALIVHAFHLDIVPDALLIARRMPARPDLLFTTDTPAKARELEAMLAARGAAAQVIVHPNRGRDVAPKLAALARVADTHDLALCLHSKKSVYLPDGADWRRALLGALAGSDAVVRDVLRLFALSPALGLVFPAHFPSIADRLSWGGNRAAAVALARRMGVRLEACRFLDFASGSMFWVRPRALAPLLALRLSPGDFPEEAGQLDATPAHAVERLFLFAAERAGYTWLAVRGAAPGDPPGLAPQDEADLRRRLRAAAARSLLGAFGAADPAPEPPGGA